MCGSDEGLVVACIFRLPRAGLGTDRQNIDASSVTGNSRISGYTGRVLVEAGWAELLRALAYAWTRMRGAWYRAGEGYRAVTDKSID